MRANCEGAWCKPGQFGAIGEDGSRRFGAIRTQFFDVIEAG